MQHRGGGTDLTDCIDALPASFTHDIRRAMKMIIQPCQSRAGNYPKARPAPEVLPKVAMSNRR